MADGLKFFLKEDFTPAHVRKFYYWLAPALTLVPALLTVCVVPFGTLHPASSAQPIKLVIADLNVGPLFIFAISSLRRLWHRPRRLGLELEVSLPRRRPLSSQMISYEIALGLSLIPVLMIFGDLNLSNIVQYQDANGWLLLPLWGERPQPASAGCCSIPLGIAFVIFTISIFAETNRTALRPSRVRNRTRRRLSHRILAR